MESILNSLTQQSVSSAQEVMSSDKIRIAVVGVGGGGCNTVHRLTNSGIKSAETVAINTDQVHLKMVNANKRLLIGQSITRGLGAGGFPEVAQKCAVSNKEKLREAIGPAELVFVCAGMGGGTGTGAAPVVAEIAKEQGAIVVSIVTYPFNLERARIQKAGWGIEQLKKASDTIIVIDNNRLVSFVPNLPMNQAFAIADEITAKAVRGISDTIMFPSLVNIDFADLRAIMGRSGLAVISVGEGKGTDKVNSVVRNTLQHPLLDVDYAGAKGALIHIAGGNNLTLSEATQIGEQLTEAFAQDANVIWGARLSPEMGDSVMVTSIMTGITSPLALGKKEEQPQDMSKVSFGIEQVQYL